MTPEHQPSCTCGTRFTQGKHLALKVAPSATLSLLIAFFPKCPVCWGVYMSMFGGLGLTHVPYLEWLFPVLMVLVGLQLIALLRNVLRAGYLPFALTLVGATIIGCARTFSIPGVWVSVTGMALIVSGSILNGRRIAR